MKEMLCRSIFIVSLRTVKFKNQHFLYIYLLFFKRIKFEMFLEFGRLRFKTFEKIPKIWKKPKIWKNEKNRKKFKNLKKSEKSEKIPKIWKNPKNLK